MTSFRIELVETQEDFLCRPNENVLAGMFRLGKRGIPTGCRGGGCGICRIQVLAGDYSCLKMSSSHISASDIAANTVLACRILPLSDLQIQVLGLMRQNVLYGRPCANLAPLSQRPEAPAK